MTASARYLVIGAAGHGQEVAWSLREQERAVGRTCEILFFDDRLPRGPVPSGLGQIVGTLKDVAMHAGREDAKLVLGVGLPGSKARIVRHLSPLGLPWARVIHPCAVVGPQVTIGDGSYVGAGAVLTVDACVGRFVTLNIHSGVTHGDVLEDFVTLHPDAHLSGNVRLHEGVEVGTGAVVIPGMSIGAWAIVGAGAAVVNSLSGNRTYVGVPATEVRRRGECTAIVS
jgi:acetyltransferase EpsM